MRDRSRTHTLMVQMLALAGRASRARKIPRTSDRAEHHGLRANET
jgi:hypothetical protein